MFRFTYRCDICSLGRNNQRLQIRINQHIPSSIRKHTSDFTTTPRSYNSPSAISRYLLANQTCSCVYTTTILETSTYVLQLFILEALLIKKKYKPELYIQKQSYAPLLFNNLLGTSKESVINRTNSAGSQYLFLQCVFFFFTPLGYSFGYNSMFRYSSRKSIVTAILWREVTERRGPLFKDLISFLWF